MLTAKIDQMGEKVGLGDRLARVGLGRSVSTLIAGIVRVFLSLFVIVIAVGLLGVETLEEPINEFILFLPRLLVAIAVVFLGVVIAGYVGDWVNRLTGQMGIEGPLGTLAGALVVAVFVVVAAAQAGIPTSLFIVLIAILAGAAALTVALPSASGAARSPSRSPRGAIWARTSGSAKASAWPTWRGGSRASSPPMCCWRAPTATPSGYPTAPS